MNVSPAKHSYAPLPRKCDYRTDRRRTKWSLCAAMLHRRHKNIQLLYCHLAGWDTSCGADVQTSLNKSMFWFFFSFYAIEQKAHIHHCNYALSVRPSLIFHIFDFSSETTGQNSLNETWQQDLNVLYEVCVFGLIGKTRWPPGLWLADAFSTSPLKPLNGIRRNIAGSKISTSSSPLRRHKFLFSGPIGKQDRRLASDWLKHFRLLLWTEFNATWQKTRSQRPLPSSYFSVRSENQDGRPGFWLTETFSTSPLNRIQWKWTGSKISTSSIKFLFYGPIGIPRWSPLPLIGRNIFDLSSETTSRIRGNKTATSSIKIVFFFSGRS